MTRWIIGITLLIGVVAVVFPPWVSTYVEESVESLESSADVTPRICVNSDLGYAPLWSPPKSHALGHRTVNGGRLLLELSAIAVIASAGCFACKD
jgi:hypothetical protein